MQHVIDKMMEHTWMVGLLAVVFACSLVAYWARIRRDERNRSGKKPVRH
jgi:hypothetical protein